MVPTATHLLLGAFAFVAITVFVAAYRFALRECADARELACGPDLPRAAIHRGGARWLAGVHRQRALGSVRVLQAGFVAVGITSIFVMCLCGIGIVGLMIFG